MPLTNLKLSPLPPHLCGLTFSPGSDLAFSAASTSPASFTHCTYSPISSYDLLSTLSASNQRINSISVNPVAISTSGSVHGFNNPLQLGAQIRIPCAEDTESNARFRCAGSTGYRNTLV